jgi:excisionase family DNA binding protein
MNTTDVRLMSIEAAAVYYGITQRSIYNLIGRGLLKPIRLPGLRRVFFDRTDLD